MNSLSLIRGIHRKFDLKRFLMRAQHATTSQEQPLTQPQTSSKTEPNNEQNSTTSLVQLNNTEIVEKKPATFASMFRKSKFVSLGNLSNKYLVGRIVEVVGDDLHIDFGGKFNCVCKRPEKNGHFYQRNTNVIIKLVDFEMASYFLSASKHLTLLEANAQLVNSMTPLDDPNEKNPRVLMFRQDIDELNSEVYY